MTDEIGLIGRFYREVLEGGNLALVDELTADNYVDHEEALPGQPPGKEGARYFVEMMRAAFPDIHIKAMDAALSAENMEACHVILTGTHRGEMAGIAPTGKTVEFDATDIVRVENGKVAEHWGTTDSLRLMQQMGAVPV
ncbi:ester cyclase [Arthrobacter oryzae]|uniref:Ester cyclase n=1 Tax=Arthrobacter oryzae TaxID=409290 RepID=A0A3N0BJ39_9MICC|nr:ester cyclase [Arthrobacter oryzae]RNL48251.1 ester cyclase [Arthrobacter oryzae]